MHPRFAELSAYLDETRAALLAASDLPDDLGAARPDPERWSVAEVLAHVSMTEGRITRLLVRLLDGAIAAGIQPERETSSILGSLDRFAVPVPTRRLVSPPQLLPEPTVRASDVRAALERTRAELLALVARANGLAVGSLSAPHPVLGPIDFYQWVLFIGQHEARHTVQIRQIAAELRTAR
jgi:hypothetical protein